MISGDMLYVFLLIMEARVYVIIKFSSTACYVNIIMSCTDREHWPDYNQVSACHTGAILAVILITLFLVTVKSSVLLQSSFLCNLQILNSNYS